MKFQTSLLCLAIASALAVAPAAQAANARRADVVNRANALINAHASAFNRASGDAFSVRDVIVDRDGTEHVRYDRTWNGMPVIGGDFVAHSRNGRLADVSQTLNSSTRPNRSGRFNADQAIVEAGAHFGLRIDGMPHVRTVVYARDTAPVLAYEVVLNGVKADQTPTEMHYFVNANTGRVLDQWDTVNTAAPACTPTAATGTGKTLLVGNVSLGTAKCGTKYQLMDPTRGGGATHNMSNQTLGMGLLYQSTRNVWGNGLLSSPDTVAADAHYGIQETWDYFLNVHNRNGIAGDGVGAISRVHYGRRYVNAFWSDACFCMTFGDAYAPFNPFVALDVAGHEMSHGVTSRTAGLVYSGQSGGLNEATSDIFGTMVEYYANNPANPPNYVVGEKLYTNNASMQNAIRWMFKPSLDQGTLPVSSKNWSRDCYSASVMSGQDVHYSSGVANHFFYLLAEGAVVPAGFGAGTWANLTPASMVCNGNTSLAGIGRAKAAAIWYKALTTYMTSGTNYAAAKTATLNAATDLYGGTSAEYNAVAAAWAAVSV